MMMYPGGSFIGGGGGGYLPIVPNPSAPQERPEKVYARKMEELTKRRAQLHFTMDVCGRRNALRRTTAFELNRASLRGTQRNLERVVAARRRAETRNAAFLDRLDTVEARVLAATVKTSAGAREFEKALAEAYDVAGTAIDDERLRRREKLDDIRSLEEAEAAVALKAQRQEARLRRDMELDDVLAAKRVAVVERRARAAEQLAALEAQRIANAARDKAVVDAYERQAKHAQARALDDVDFQLDNDHSLQPQDDDDDDDDKPSPSPVAASPPKQRSTFYNLPDEEDYGDDAFVLNNNNNNNNNRDDDDDDEPDADDLHDEEKRSDTDEAKDARPRSRLDDLDSLDGLSDTEVPAAVENATALVLGGSSRKKNKLSLDYSSFGSMASIRGAHDDDEFDDD